jgi:hypothetical protein
MKHPPLAPFRNLYDEEKEIISSSLSIFLGNLQDNQSLCNNQIVKNLIGKQIDLVDQLRSKVANNAVKIDQTDY